MQEFARQILISAVIRLDLCCSFIFGGIAGVSQSINTKANMGWDANGGVRMRLPPDDQANGNQIKLVNVL